MKSEFQKNFEAFCRIFQSEKRSVAPLVKINNKAILEIREEGSKLIEEAVFLTRMNYLTQTQKNFNLEDYIFCLKDFSTLSTSDSLRLFKKPNHKDRFSLIISFLSKNTSILSQIVYFFLKDDNENNIISEDDKSFFCFSTIPAIFLYFITKESQEAALLFFENLFQFYFTFDEKFTSTMLKPEKKIPKFLDDIVFGYFLATNPGYFFDNAIEPVLNITISFIQDIIYYYTKTLCRTSYWKKVIHFVRIILERMTSMIYLLPISARKLITLLIQSTEKNNESELKYKLIVDNIICRYITTYIRSPNMILLSDAAIVLRTSCSIPTYIGKEATQLVLNSNIKQLIDNLFNAVKTDKETTSDFSLALNLIGSFTFITPRDLGLLFRSITSYVELCEKPSTPTEVSANRPIIKKKFTGIDIPSSNSDQKYLQLRTSFTDQTVSNVKLAYTNPYDDLVDIINSIDTSHWEYSTPEELIDKLFKFQPFPIDTILKSTITPEILSDTEKVLTDIKNNKELLNSFLQKLSKSIFVLQNEREQFSMQCKIHRGIIMKKFVVPYIHDKNPFDFIFKLNDLFSPSTLYGKLIDNVDKRIQPLQLSTDNTFELKKIFILEFIDQIDIQFEFQTKVAKEKISKIYSDFCQGNSDTVMKLSPQISRILSNASMELQFVKNYQKISSNLTICLNAVRSLSVFDNKVAAIAMAISISGNPEIFGFLYFVNGYFKDVITNIILNEEERGLLDIFKEAGRALRLDILKNFSLC